ncbi:MAG: metallophosphoesterase [Victivallales bacterium]|nr:metallophosphoesterase [Victivallales bacterium]
MSSFIYIADTHIGAGAAGYKQQPAFRSRMPEIIDALSDWMRKNGPVDFVLHGGDIIDETSEESIISAVELFGRLPAPTRLCLGNHDLTSLNASEEWLRLGANFFNDGSPVFTISQDDLAVHIVPTHWCEIPYHWNIAVQDARFSEDQLEKLETELSRNSEKIQVLATHNPVFGLPVEQTGFDKPHHAPNEAFTNTVLSILERHQTIKLVLGAHNHMNMRVERGGANFATASSLTETPFEFKHILAADGKLEMRTISLAEKLGFKAEYNFDKTFVQGRSIDREII